jgi:hypothetical protein
MDQQALGPGVPIESLLDSIGFLFGGRYDHQTKMAFGNKRPELPESSACIHVCQAFAGNVVRWTAKVYTD